MTARTMNPRQFEEHDNGSNGSMKILSAVALFGVALLLVYICVAAPQPGTSMGAIRNVLCGLGGSLAVALPAMLIWAGVLCLKSARGHRVNALVAACDALLFVCLFTAVHIFFAERIRLEKMTIQGFANFVSKSYGYGKGGGALGALLSWPLYRNFGVTGGFLAVLLLAVLLLTATGRVGRLVRWLRKRGDARQETREDKQMFEKTEEARPRRASRSRVSRDPFSEALTGGAAIAANMPRRSAPRTSAQPAVASRGKKAASASVDNAARPAQPQGRRRSAPAAPAPAMAANPPRRRKKLYNEEVEPAAEKDSLFDGFDDFDRLEAESAALDKLEKDGKARRKGFEPDRPAALKADAEPKPEKARRKGFEIDRPSSMRAVSEGIVDIPDAPPEDIPGAVPVVKADKKSNVSIDDLKIEPEAYEAPDDDEPPFDLPQAKPKREEKVAAGIAEKPVFPKIRRVKEAEPADDVPPYNYPPLDLLSQGEVEDTSIHNNRDMQKAQLLEETLKSFGISAKLTGIAHGPAVTRFELQPAPGVKVSRITSLSDDIALNLAAMSVRIEAPIPGKAAVGVEIPNDKVEMVRLRDVLESPDARKHPSRIAVGLGKDNSGRYIVADIAKMPHVLIAGQTGSGKSVCINAIITSILFRSSPEEVKLILIDPKVVELSVYNNIPHLVCPVVTDPKKAASALDWAVAEMTKRYKLFAERGVRDIKGYNKALKDGEKLMPQMVIIIDELADLMMVSPGEVEDSICRLAQLARACGMHLVIATQRPSVNVITGIIKANIPTRIAFSVASQVDSRTMIDHGGAEKLLGNGDMLFVPNGMKSMRVQGAWVSDDEVHNIVEYIKQSGEAEYDPDMLEHMENATRSDAEKEEFEAEYDNKLPEAVDSAIDLGQVSISMLQRKMRIGYDRAGRIIDEMSRRGIVSEADGSKPREVLITREQAHEMFEDCA